MPKSDSRKLTALLKLLREQVGKPSAENAVADALMFLDGNEDKASIGCNLGEHPGLQAFRDVVARVSRRDDVSSLKVIISEDMGDEEFPFVDTIFVCTSASGDELMEEFESLSPDEVFDPDKDTLKTLPKAQTGHQWRAVWWD